MTHIPWKPVITKHTTAVYALMAFVLIHHECMTRADECATYNVG
jgi:hypothetical protein